MFPDRAPGIGGGSADGELFSLTNWVDAIRYNRQPSAPIAAGVTAAAAAAHLDNEAYRQDRVAERKP